jgi:hypothetical protein
VTATIPDSPQQNLLNTVTSALAQGGVTVLEADKQVILTKAYALTSLTINKVTNAFASNVQPHGFASLAGPSIRAALVNSEPDLDTLADQAEASAFDELCTFLQSLVSKSSKV